MLLLKDLSGIKTDAILVSESRFKLEKLFTFDSSEIGGLKFEKEKYCTNRKICQLANETFIINVSTVSCANLLNGVTKSRLCPL